MPSCPPIEEALLPLGGAAALGQVLRRRRPTRSTPLYPRMADFRALRDRVDPDRVFGNAFLDRVLG